MQASKATDGDTCRLLLEKGASVRAKDSTGSVPLHRYAHTYAEHAAFHSQHTSLWSRKLVSVCPCRLCSTCYRAIHSALRPSSVPDSAQSSMYLAAAHCYWGSLKALVIVAGPAALAGCRQ